jgi:hypothetical protein
VGWAQGLMLARQELYHLSHTPSPFCSGYLLRQGLILRPDWPGSQSCFLHFLA